jgi:GNAT superfamily N-acetyltransferase
LIRPATAADLEAVGETLALAFEHDPVWGWGFADLEGGEGARERKLAGLRAVFGFAAAAALAYEWVWISGDAAAVALWIPPGVPEMSAEDAERFPAVVRDACGPRVAPRALALMEAFERVHPAEPAHYYLSVLGTHPDHAGQGLGMGLVAANLELIDAEGATAFLESSNPANLRRYQRLGFRPDREVELVGDLTATQMWRGP